MRLAERVFFAGFLLLLLAACADSGGIESGDARHHFGDAAYSVLVFTKTSGFRHASIEPGVEAVKNLGREHGFAVDHTEDAELFNEENLSRYAAVVFLNTSETILNDDQRHAFKSYIQGGGGFVGIHAATDTEYDWPWYGQLVGAYFANHPQNQTATIQVLNREHLSTRHLPEEWERYDEWYNFRDAPTHVNVLANLDETTYEGGEMGENHPIAWYHEFDGGRAWYTAGGHTEESYSEPLFVQHILGGIQWAAGRADTETP